MTGPLAWIGLTVVLAALLVRTTVPSTTLPGWDLDPTLFSIITPALGPAGSMLVDALALLGAALLLADQARRGLRVGIGWVLGAAVGSATVILHGWWWQAIGSAAPHGTLGNQRIGLAWVAGLWCAIAVLHAARDPLVRRTIAGVLLGFIALLALRGAQQVFIDHPITVAAFNADRDRWLAARGWSADSPMALAYIRRLNQPEATGWMGLSNVVASFGGLGAGIAGAWVWSELARKRRAEIAASPATGGGGDSSAARIGGGVTRPWTLRSLKVRVLIPSTGLVASCATVYLAGSRGGYAAAIIAGAMAMLGMLASQTAALASLRRLVGSLIGPACIFGVLLAVVARGFVGERIGELSILFRWFYMQAAARIFAEHPLKGVGPDGFQLAYLTAKNPLNPEEVTSPHSILLDWAATLGAGGLVWGAVLLALSVLVGRALVARDEPTGEPAPAPLRAGGGGGGGREDGGRWDWSKRAGMLTLAIATIASSWLESPYITPDTALVRMLGLLLGCGLAHAAVSAASDRGVRVGLGAGSLAMLAHAQIELTGSHVASAGLFLVTIAAAAAGARPSDVGPRVATRANARGLPTLTPAIASLACIAIAALAASGGYLRARAWESDLKQAAASLSPLAEINERFAALHKPATPGQRPEDPAKFFSDVSKLLGRPVPPTADGWTAAAIALDAKFFPPAAAMLERAQARYPDEWRVGREAGRLYVRLMEPVRDQPGTAAYLLKQAVSAIPTCVPPADSMKAMPNPPRARAIAVVYEAGAGNKPGLALEAAAATLGWAWEHDPYNLDIALKMFRMKRTLGDAKVSRAWAAKALELDAYCRLDRATRGLSARDRAEIEAAIRDQRETPPTPPSSPPP